MIRIVFDDLGLDPDPDHMAEVVDWMHDYVGELFAAGLPWRPGARELLDALLAADVPMALVTNTRRALTENALNTIGRQYFSTSVCGDEVQVGSPPRTSISAPPTCSASTPVTVWRSRIRSPAPASAEGAGCPVLVVPNDVEVPTSPRRRHVASLSGMGIRHLLDIYSRIAARCR